MHALIATIVVGLSWRLLSVLWLSDIRVSPIVGYLLAGVMIGPFTPGFVADQALATGLPKSASFC